MITASCGHEISREENDNNNINTKDFAKDGSRVVVYQVVCNNCLKFYKRKKLILENEDEEEKWFKGELKY